MTASAFSSWLLSTDCAAAIRLAGSGDNSVRPPSAASTVRRRRLLRRTAAALSGSLSTAAPVAASMTLPSAPVTKTFLVSGSADSRPSCSALMMGMASGLPETATAPIASSVSEKSSLANLATASSNGPAKRRHRESRCQKNRDKKRAKTIEEIGRHDYDPGRSMRRRRRHHRLLRSSVVLLEVIVATQTEVRSPDRRTCWSWCCSCRTSCRPSRRSGPWSHRVPSTRRRQRRDPGSSTPRRTGRWL